VLVLGIAVTGATATLGLASRELAEELRVRSEVLCARYGALAGLALGASPGDQAATVDAGIGSLRTTYVARSASWCVLRSIAVCGDALRTVERTAPLDACAAG
jgi:hypothetical protein